MESYILLIGTTKKIKLLLISLLQKVDEYIDFLNYEYSEWAEQLSEDKIQLIEKETKNMEENRLVFYKENKKRIKDYIKNKDTI